MSEKVEMPEELAGMRVLLICYPQLLPEKEK
jgi:hypothetical protein